jgi:hypothetical protein
MGYLIAELYWFELAAFAIGLVAGWVACDRVED